jgi:hypothetical protein
MQTTRLFFLVIVSIIMLTGCLTHKAAAERIYEILEKAAAEEKLFMDQQGPLVSLEKEEKAIYDKIISLGSKEQNEINKLSEEALHLTNKRQERLENEEQSIKASEKEFRKADDVIKELKDDDVKKQAEALSQTMAKRYDAHEALYEDYLSSLKYDRELYEMFKEKDVTLDQLEDQVNKLNDMYRQVFKANESFNQLTEKYNDEKLRFYKKAGLKIEK